MFPNGLFEYLLYVSALKMIKHTVISISYYIFHMMNVAMEFMMLRIIAPLFFCFHRIFRRRNLEGGFDVSPGRSPFEPMV